MKNTKKIHRNTKTIFFIMNGFFFLHKHKIEIEQMYFYFIQSGELVALGGTQDQV